MHRQRAVVVGSTAGPQVSGERDGLDSRHLRLEHTLQSILEVLVQDQKRVSGEGAPTFHMSPRVHSMDEPGRE